MRGVALVLALLWAGWWVFFATGDAVMRHEFGGAITLAVVVIGTVAIAWKWPSVGGVLLILDSIASIAIWAPMWIHRFNVWQVVLMFAIMPLPPLVAGVLLLLSSHRHTPPPAVHAA
jgi:hypothetical protein